MKITTFLSKRLVNVNSRPGVFLSGFFRLLEQDTASVKTTTVLVQLCNYSDRNVMT